MSIEVRCPNPTCGRVHRVKNKYAGKRGQCPSCGDWMMIPAPALAGPPLASPVFPHAPEPVPPPMHAPPLGLDEATLLLPPEESALPHEWHAPRPGAALDEDVTVIDVPDEVPARASRAPAALPKRRLEPEVEVADEVIEEAELDEEEPRPRKSTRRFSWLVCAMLFFATLGLGAGSVVPHLDGPTAKATGPLQRSPKMRALKSYVPDDYLWPVTIAPASVALLAVLGLMVAMGTRNFGFFPLLTTYLATLTTVAGLALAITSAFHVQEAFDDMTAQARRLGNEQRVELTTSWGLGPPVALIGGASALFLFSVSLLLMHRRAFTRILSVLVLLVACGAGVVVILTSSSIPPSVRSLWGG
jgi:hypothetical protein